MSLAYGGRGMAAKPRNNKKVKKPISEYLRDQPAKVMQPSAFFSEDPSTGESLEPETPCSPPETFDEHEALNFLEARWLTATAKECTYAESSPAPSSSLDIEAELKKILERVKPTRAS
eukprot:TRINITY_DN9385_c0_g1_i1.p1 TRINITY_DN9385_c0_g1~~TRINITY_DN9385_c0_g1_i1.p1  ORF type:complete len:137 (+),score=33.55 TRINITY_DN9385_c0_g1_i1:58-411(+)